MVPQPSTFCCISVNLVPVCRRVETDSLERQPIICHLRWFVVFIRIDAEKQTAADTPGFTLSTKYWHIEIYSDLTGHRESAWPTNSENAEGAYVLFGKLLSIA